MQPTKKIVLDVECYRNYFMVGLRNIDTGKTLVFELYDGCDFDRELLDRLIRKNQIITFNGNHYDMPMVTLAISGASKRVQEVLTMAGFNELFDLYPTPAEALAALERA